MADHIGIYNITGTVLSSVSTIVSIPDDLTTNAHGVVYDILPSAATLVTLGNEVISHNAMHSGSESIDSQTKREIYLSKQTRLSHFVHKHIATMFDVYNNIPDTAPITSSVVSASISGLPAYGAEIGSFSAGMTVSVGTGSIASLNIDLAGAALTASTQILAALQGNIIFVTSGSSAFTASVDVATAGTPPLIVLHIPTGYSSRSVDFTSGSVRILSLASLSSSVSGVYINRTYYAPTEISVQVSERGQIRDIRTWVEFVHDANDPALTASYTGFGLQGIQIALKSPNTSFYSAHPLWNSSIARSLPLRTSNGMEPQYYQVPKLLQNSYLLWAGHEVENGLSDTIVTSSFYHEFDHDIHMRTVFWDGSTYANPRDLTRLFPSANTIAVGDPLDYDTLLDIYASPTSGAISFAFQTMTNSLTCSAAPWMLDNRISTGSVFISEVVKAIVSGSPPPGWLTGDPAEFLTSGSNLGPPNIRPVYPLLDDVLVRKAYIQQATVTGAFSLPQAHGLIVGSRPGLRGTQVSGTWNVSFGSVADSYTTSYAANSLAGVWLRQVRLEFVIDTGIGTFEFIPSRSRKWSKSTLVPGHDGPQNIGIISGSSAWDVGVGIIQRSQEQEYGRTVSITSDKSATSFAVMSFLSGALNDSLNAQGVSSAPWFIGGNGFGTPYIPDSSMSLGDVAAEQIDASASAEMYNQTIGQTTMIPNANTLYDYLNREDYSKTTEQRWSEALKQASSK